MSKISNLKNFIYRKKNKLLEFFRYYDLGDFKKPKDSIILILNDKFGIKMGLADRLRHCLSVYLTIRSTNKTFKIKLNDPFNLEDYLKPNLINWAVSDEDISYSFFWTKYIQIFSYYKGRRMDEFAEEKLQKTQLLKVINSSKYLQYHIYGNSHIDKNRWQLAFDELFKPSKNIVDRLQELNLPNIYEAVTLRFQQLLGDFKEDGFDILDDESQVQLIERNLQKIKDLYIKSYFSTEYILITSDSTRFLEEASKLPFVKTIPGKRVHPATPKEIELGEDPYINSFVDLFALKNAKKISLLKTGNMYLSGFPEFAAYIGGKPFSIIEF